MIRGRGRVQRCRARSTQSLVRFVTKETRCFQPGNICTGHAGSFRKLNENKKYVYDCGWIYPLYSIPLQVTLDVFKSSSYSGSITSLANSIRETLLEEFDSKFGINQSIWRSDIIETVQNVDGVEHCRLIDPGTNIFFDFDIDNFTQTQLLEYGPEYVYFTEDSIAIRIF